MNRVLNLEMMANPFNWAIIYLVVVFCGIAARAVLAQNANSTKTA